MNLSLPTVVLSMMPLLACTKAPDTGKVQASGLDLEGKTRAVMDSTKEAAGKAQAEYHKLVETKLTALEERIGELRARASSATSEGKAEMEKFASDLGEKRKVLAQKLGELKSVSQDQWESLKKDFDTTIADIEKSIDGALKK